MSSQWLAAFLPILEVYYTLPGTEQFYWENVMMELLNGTARKRIKEAGITSIGSQSADEVLSLAEHMEMDINRQPSDQVYEFENLEELRVFDESYQNHSNNQAMELISSVFQIPESEIHNIHCLKSGMTNKSFLFQVHGKSYICRVPGSWQILYLQGSRSRYRAADQPSSGGRCAGGSGESWNYRACDLF